MIEVKIWKSCVMKQIMTKVGNLKIDDDGHTMMSSDAIYYCDIFSWYAYRWVPLIFTLDSYPTVFCTVKTNWIALER